MYVVENEAHMGTDTLLLSQKSKSTVSTTSQFSRNISDFEDEIKMTSKPKALQINIITPELAAALDRGKVTSRNAVFIVAATLKSANIDIRGCKLSHSTIHRARKKFRSDMAAKLKDGLRNQDNFVLHWDGKILPDIIGTEKVDRLPIIISSSGSEQILRVPKMGSGTAKNQAEAIVKTLFDWGISRKIKALSFDTAAVNTGSNSYLLKYLHLDLNWSLSHKLIFYSCPILYPVI